jgi:hypothetical protein
MQHPSAPRALAVIGSFAAALALTTGARAQSTPPPVPTPMPAASTSPTPALSPAPLNTYAPMRIAARSPAPGQSATAAVSPTPIPTPVNPPENALVTERVRRTFVAWQRGHVDRKAYSPYAGGTYLPAYVAIVQPILNIGSPQTVTYQTATPLLGDIVYRYEIAGSGGAISMLYALDQDGRTDGVVFTPEIFRVGGAQQ